jgi:PAS domain S-box-containing protein
MRRRDRVEGLVVVSRDITSRKRFEERLSILERVVEEMDHFVVVTDTDGRITWVNPAVERRFGYSLDELLGQRARILLASTNPPGLAEEIWTSTTHGRWSGDLLNVTRAGEEFWVSLDTTLVHEGDRPMAMVSLSRDITDRKGMELELERAVRAAEDASRAKGEFVANMSHEIRTPLNAIVGLIHLLQRTELDARQRGLAGNLDRASVTLLDIVNDILDFSKIEAGHLELENVDFSLGELLDELATLVQTRARTKDVEVLFRTDPEIPPGLVGDPLRLRQVLVNLCDNAIKFTDSGEVVVRTLLEERTQNEIVLRFAVRDTGIGISAEQQSRLFQPFSQADGSTSRRFGGSGLGLSICKRLVEMMGGRISVDSEPGRGSEFVFTASFGIGTVAIGRRVASDLRGLRVLVVDDNATARLTMQEMLTQLAFSVTVSSSAAEAIATLEAAPPDRPFELVLMDWQMPGMDGLEATRRIKSNARLALVPTIIMVTAFGREEVLGSGGEGLLDGFLVKPIRPSVLFDAISGVLHPGTDGSASPSERTTRTEWEPLRGARILLVEDNPVNQLVAREILEEEGIRVEVADNGEEALRAVEGGEFDAVLMDIQMPVMDGIETTVRIRASARHRALPVIALTASAMSEDRERFLAAGMVDFVPKPIDPEHLFAVLLRWVGPAHRRGAAGSRSGRHARTTGEEQPPILDVEGGLARLRGRESLHRRILASFLDSSSTLVDELGRALEDGETRECLRLAHSLKGSAATVGAERVRDAAATLELRLDERGTDEVGDAHQVLRRAIHEARQAIMERLGRPDG